MPEDISKVPPGGGLSASRLKPTVAELGIDLAAQDWQRSGTSDGSFEVAFVRAAASLSGAASPVAAWPGASSTPVTRPDARPDTRDDDVWVLLRVAGDPAGRVLVYDRTEWECFLDGARRGEFDDDAG